MKNFEIKNKHIYEKAELLIQGKTIITGCGEILEFFLEFDVEQGHALLDGINVDYESLKNFLHKNLLEDGTCLTEEL